jgi:hypothetical protein
MEVRKWLVLGTEGTDYERTSRVMVIFYILFWEEVTWANTIVKTDLTVMIFAFYLNFN